MADHPAQRSALCAGPSMQRLITQHSAVPSAKSLPAGESSRQVPCCFDRRRKGHASCPLRFCFREANISFDTFAVSAGTGPRPRMSQSTIRPLCVGSLYLLQHVYRHTERRCQVRKVEPLLGAYVVLGTHLQDTSRKRGRLHGLREFCGRRPAASPPASAVLDAMCTRQSACQRTGNRSIQAGD
jgi:hypothetical protein